MGLCATAGLESINSISLVDIRRSIILAFVEDSSAIARIHVDVWAASVGASRGVHIAVRLTARPAGRSERHL
jgi:hypothetical protein